MPTLYDAEGKPQKVTDPEAAKQAYLGGTLLPTKGQQVPIVRPDTGEVENVVAEDLHQAINQGAQLATDQQVRKTELEAKYGKPGSALAAANAFIAHNLGAGRGATGPLLDKAIIEGAGLLLGKDKKQQARQTLNELKELHPISSAVGEVGGGLAASLAGGYGLGPKALPGASRGLGVSLLPGAGIARLGAGVEALAARGGAGLLGEGSGLARVATKGLAYGAQGATEAALYQGLHELDEAVLGDADLNGEKIAAHMKHAAIWGGGIGVGLGTAGGILGEGVAKMAPFMQKQSRLQAVRILDAKQPDLRQLDNFHFEGLTGPEAFGEYLKRNIKPGDTFDSVASRVIPEQFKKATGQLDDLTQRITGHPEGYVDAGSLIGGIRKMAAERRKNWGHGHIADALDNWASEAEASLRAVPRAANDNAGGGLRMTFSEARKQRAALDDSLQRAYMAQNPTLQQQDYKAMRRLFEDEIEKAVDRVGVSTKDPTLLKDYESAKTAYRWAKLAEGIVEKSERRELANRSYSLSDHLMGLGGLILGGPKGLLIGGVSALANKWMRKHGNSYAALTLDHLANLGVVRSITEQVDGRVEQSVASYFGRASGRPKTRFTSKKDSDIDTNYEQAEKEVKGYEANSEDLQRRLAERTSDLATKAPKTQSALAGTMLRGAIFLQQKLPKEDKRLNTLQAPLESPLRTRAEKAKFLLYKRSVESPLDILDDLRTGHLAPEQVEAVKTVYPKLFAQIQDTVVTYVAKETEAGREIPLQKRLQLSELLGVPLDSSQDPAFIGRIQAAKAPPPPPPKPVGRPAKPFTGFAAQEAAGTQDNRDQHKYTR